MNTTPDAQTRLIDSCISGDRQAAQRLYHLYAVRMHGVCSGYAKNKCDAEDILQEGFIKIFRNLHRYRYEGSFEGWMRRIMVNTALSYSRKSGIDVSVEDLEEFVVSSADSTIHSLMEKDLRKVTEKLSRGYKIVFYLRAVEGYSHHQIAQKLGISANTSKSQYSRARIILQKWVTDQERVRLALSN